MYSYLITSGRYLDFYYQYFAATYSTYMAFWDIKKETYLFVGLLFKFIRSVCYACGSTDTYDFELAFFLKVTIPSVNANRVWSLPIPTFTPG